MFGPSPGTNHTRSIKRTKKGVDQMLKRLPTNLKDTYETALPLTPNAKYLHKALCIIIAARKPLVVRAMNLAIEISEQTESWDDIDCEDDQVFANRLVVVGCGLISTSIHLAQANYELAILTSKYLDALEYPIRLSSGLHRPPFGSYAAKYWTTHIQAVLETGNFSFFKKFAADVSRFKNKFEEMEREDTKVLRYITAEAACRDDCFNKHLGVHSASSKHINRRSVILCALQPATQSLHPVGSRSNIKTNLTAKTSRQLPMNLHIRAGSSHLDHHHRHCLGAAIRHNSRTQKAVVPDRRQSNFNPCSPILPFHSPAVQISTTPDGLHLQSVPKPSSPLLKTSATNYAGLANPRSRFIFDAGEIASAM
ncbi:hypothetical protein BKA81DRAFT_425735 [Phyllosticta paracitricarpa]